MVSRNLTISQNRPRYNAASAKSQPSPPLQTVYIDWEQVLIRRPMILDSIEAMPKYLLKNEVHTIIGGAETPMMQTLLSFLWATGARVSEALAMTPACFIEDRCGYGVMLKPLKQGPGRRSKRALQRSPKRYIPLKDPNTQQQIMAYLFMGKFRKDERIFPISRQTVDRHIRRIAKREGLWPFSISANTFRHSFAVHLVLHAVPIDYISQLLGHRSVKSTEIYTCVLTSDSAALLDGVSFFESIAP